MAAFALIMPDRGTSPERILMLLDERRDADEIAFELRRKGQDVTVREMKPPVEPGLARPAFGPGRRS